MQWDAAIEVFEEARGEGLGPDIVVYRCMLHMLARVGLPLPPGYLYLMDGPPILAYP